MDVLSDISVSHQPTLQVITRADITADFIAKWLQLETAAIEPNAFLSPNFIVPTIKNIPGFSSVTIAAVYLDKNKQHLIALSIFMPAAANKKFPYQHSQTLRSDHTFLTGMLADRKYADVGIGAIFQYLQANPIYKATYFHDISAESKLFKIMQQKAELFGGRWVKTHEYQRAARFDSSAEANLSSKKRSELRRQQRRLNELGKLTWNCYRDTGITQDKLDAFLHMENAGWKGEDGTSLASCPHNENFFKQSSELFAKSNQLLICELQLDAKPIAMAINYISQNTVYGFKLGWDPQYAKYSPSMLNLYLCYQHLPQHFPGIEYFDSCSKENSFMEKVLPHKRTLVCGAFVFGRKAQLLAEGLRLGKIIYNRMK